MAYYIYITIYYIYMTIKPDDIHAVLLRLGYRLLDRTKTFHKVDTILLS